MGLGAQLQGLPTALDHGGAMCERCVPRRAQARGPLHDVVPAALAPIGADAVGFSLGFYESDGFDAAQAAEIAQLGDHPQVRRLRPFRVDHQGATLAGVVHHRDVYLGRGQAAALPLAGLLNTPLPDCA